MSVDRILLGLAYILGDWTDEFRVRGGWEWRHGDESTNEEGAPVSVPARQEIGPYVVKPSDVDAYVVVLRWAHGPTQNLAYVRLAEIWHDGSVLEDEHQIVMVGVQVNPSGQDAGQCVRSTVVMTLKASF